MKDISRRAALRWGAVAAAAPSVAALWPATARAAAPEPPERPALPDPVSGNPIITDIYTADPDAFVWNGTFYLDTDRDRAPLGATDFVMTDWHVYSSTDAVHWVDHGVRLSLSDFPWANRDAWAPQMIPHHGKFYRYLPMQQASTNSMSIGVVVGDSALGPFEDATGGPLISIAAPNHSSFDIDPTVLVDDDGQAYLYWGSFSSPRAAKLKPNMIEIEELQPAAALEVVGDFVGEVNGIRGSQLTDAQADELVASAGRITSTIHQTLS